ncbi:MAG: hypothetical protein QM302_05395 [Acidobacteriota bacterium]|nr:hypothetical protein [Acidobacteriota bacterium]
MTYDPRAGASPYLGMDVDLPDELGDEGVDEPGRTTMGAGRARSEAGARDVPHTVLRPAQAPRRAVVPRRMPDQRTAEAAPLYRQGPAGVPQAAPSPPQQAPYQAPSRRVAPQVGRRLPRPLAFLAAQALHLLALALRLAAIALAASFVLAAVLTDAHRATLVSALNLTSSLIPPGLLGVLVYETPFGGALRGDLAIASIILFCADWLCMRLSASLRERREGSA